MSAQLVEVILPAESPSLVLPAEQPYVTETATGLTFDPGTPIEVWGALTERLQRQAKRIEWALADALIFGENAYSEDYAQWVEETGLAKRTLQNIARIGRAIEPARRRADVSFSHHAEVITLPVPEQEKLLDRAESVGMTRYDLRDAVRERKRQIEDQAATPEPESLVWVPQLSDLTDEARDELDRRLAGIGKRHAIGYERAWLDCLVFTEQREMFREWKN